MNSPKHNVVSIFDQFLEKMLDEPHYEMVTEPSVLNSLRKETFIKSCCVWREIDAHSSPSRTPYAELDISQLSALKSSSSMQPGRIANAEPGISMEEELGLATCSLPARLQTFAEHQGLEIDDSGYDLKAITEGLKHNISWQFDMSCRGNEANKTCFNIQLGQSNGHSVIRIVGEESLNWMRENDYTLEKQEKVKAHTGPWHRDYGNAARAL